MFNFCDRLGELHATLTYHHCLIDRLVVGLSRALICALIWTPLPSFGDTALDDRLRAMQSTGMSADETPILANANSYWVQAQLALSVYDLRREVFSGRLSPGLQVGRRFESVGYFLNFEIDRNFDFNQRVERLDVLHVGPGIEWLLFGGRLRSSLSVGMAVLASDTDIEERGKRGWYVDLRPLSLRLKVGSNAILELTPLSVDASIPVPNGLPLVIFSHMTLISIEWATVTEP